MTKKVSTKRALLMSALALLMCVSMLIGSTFAWFTDSVTSGNNIIKSGNLDIELEYWNGTAWMDVKGASDILKNQLWEPGVTEVAYLRVANAGSLVLKYQLGINILSEIEGKNQENETFKLSDYIMFGVVEGVNGKTHAYSKDDAGRAAAIAAVTDSKKISAGYTKAATMNPDNELYLALVVYMPTDVGNVANHNGTDVPQIDLGINIYATQKDAESDSFGPDYDKDASAFVSTAEELKNAIATVKDGGTVYVNAGTYEISSQINIDGKSINIVGLGDATVKLTQSGQKAFYIYGNKVEGNTGIDITISNIKIEGNNAKSDIWVRTWTNSPRGDVNLTLDNVTCTSVIADNNYSDGTIVNIDVQESKIGKITLDASPFNSNGHETYTNLIYDDASRIDSINIQSGVNDLTHITINGVTPTAHGEQQPLTYVDTLEELQTALDNAVDGDIIVLCANVTGDVTATQKPDVKFTIDGAGHTFTGVILVDGKSATYTTAGLTIMNVNFEADSISADACIRLGNGTNATRYTCNVTVKDCTFNVPGAVGVKSYTGGDKNLTIIGCTATEVTHSLVQAKGIDGVLVENCEVYSKNGLNFNNSNNVTVDSCTVDVKGYAVRFGESKGGTGAAETYAVKNSTLKSANDDGDAVIILRGTADNSTLTVTNTTLTGDIKITDTASKATIIIDGKYYVSTADELATVVANGETNIYLLDGEYNVKNCGGKTLTLTGISKNAVLAVTGGEQGEANGQLDYGFDSSTVIFNNLTIKTNNKTYAGYARLKGTYNDCVFENCFCLNGDSVFTNCTLNVSGDQYNIWTWGAPTAVFTDCTFNSDGKAMLLYGTANTKLTLNNCVFNDTGVLPDLKAAVEIGNDYNKSYELIITGTVVHGYEINDKGINTNTTLWANKNSMGTDKLNVVVDGIDVY